MRALLVSVIIAMFLSACAGVEVSNSGQTAPASFQAQPTPTPNSVAEPPTVTPEPAANDSFTCDDSSALVLGITVWRSPSLNLEGLNDVYVVPIHLDSLAEGGYSESDGYPSVLKMKGLETSDYEACRKTFSNDLKERIIDWSPNGEQILVYESTDRCNGDVCPPFRSDLYIYEVGVDSTTKVASLENDYNGGLGNLDLQAAFSPDGHRVAYIAGDEEGGKRIMVTDLTGKTSRTLVTSENDAAVVTSLQWSPDGTSILFSRECPPSVGEAALGCSGIWSLEVDDLAGAAKLSNQFSPQQQYALGEGREPVWSPDGQEIAFTNFEGIWVADPHSVNRRLVAPWCAGWSCGRVRWSPDGNYLALKYDSDNRQTTGAYGDEVWKISADGNSKQRVSPALIEVDGPPQWSPDGNWIAYGGCSRRGCYPYVTKADGSATILVPLSGSVERGSVLQWKP